MFVFQKVERFVEAFVGVIALGLFIGRARASANCGDLRSYPHSFLGHVCLFTRGPRHLDPQHFLFLLA